jgi:hypothetical protein
MKLLSKTQAQSGIKRSNQKLVDEGVVLQKAYKNLVAKYNSAKDNYDPEKIAALEEFETFKADIVAKKSKLLAELNAVTEAVEAKKELYYALVEKADELTERTYQANERDKKLDLRENFVKDLEKKHYT